MSWALAGAVLLAGAAAAQPAPSGSPRADASPRDGEFGVVSRRFGLERRVEMYQWRAAGQAYEKVWSASPIASADFAPGHDNPGALPLASRRFMVERITLDGHPLDAEVVARLGQWRSFRPGFSNLPGNLSATFQPEGDGLGSAENPLDPQIGDLRVTWRELALPSLEGQVVLHDGVWELQAKDEVSRPVASENMAMSVGKREPAWLLAAGILMLAILMLVVRARRRQR